ncbi:hypothetical protein BD289DRAFT_4666 [Coniella lustricola]|uniref:Amino-acid acetyltransferase, mitochondrial n=1 Tax=Coniella lustricola TaxID=2025994 RepID=A0A2T3ANU6_9PEZI|nr:hypothetical protein BD289DRAFT_4666 [Coniella lustricola]
MILRHAAWKQASLVFEASVRTKSTSSKTTAASQNFRVSSPKEDISHSYLKEHYASIPKKAQQKRSQDRDFYVSVLESSATKRDARQYIQTFGPTVTQAYGAPTAASTGAGPSAASNIPVDPLTNGARSIYETPRFVQGPVAVKQAVVDALPHVAVIQFKLPQEVDDATLRGVARTITQLRALGLLSVIVPDCEIDPQNTQWSRSVNKQVYRLAGAIDEFGEPWTIVVDGALKDQPRSPTDAEPFLPFGRLRVDEDASLLQSLLKGAVVILPPVVQGDDAKSRAINPSDAVLTVTRYLTGLQLPAPSVEDHSLNRATKPHQKAFVDRVIVLDPHGGIPAKNRGNNAHVFLNLEDELEGARTHIISMGLQSATMSNALDVAKASKSHLENLELTKNILAILPSTSSALITTPSAAANLLPQQPDDATSMGFVGAVGTRRSHNPLIHNLLTDRPSHSASLPLGRIKPILFNTDPSSSPIMSPTTLVKRGMPVTIYPEPSPSGWTPPKPSQPRLKLTDTCVDLPRLVHLIDDSFNRKLDVQDYLKRVEKSLAGIIIAGEYEGGAILTWEAPFGLDEETLYKTGRMVPYLDKFAVLKRAQGAGGVADIVFNAMVRDCFPEGVCWRSRKNNPVNKWYFERSRGTMKLAESNWSMFWTTPNVGLQSARLKDYEDVCRNIQPSWADNKHIVD